MSGPEKSLSVLKAVAVLRAVGTAAAPVSVSDTIASTGYGKTVVLRMLATLHAEDLIARDPTTGGYTTGFRLIEFAQKSLKQSPLILRANQFIDEIISLTQDCGLLMVRDGRESLCIDKRLGTTPIRDIGSEVGTRSPIHAGGGPFALLAFAEDDVVDEYLSQPLQTLTERTVVDPVKVRERIAEARERGFTIGNEDLFEYVVAVGVPIRDDSGKLLGSFSIGGINLRYPYERCMEVGEQLKKLLASPRR